MSQRVRGLLDRLLARRRESAGDGVPDTELLRRYARDRDDAAFELLVWRHGAMVLGLCRRAVRDEGLAEDAFQAVFLVLARKAGGVRGNLGGWLFRVARRVSARAARRPVTHPPVEAAAAAEPDAVERQELAALLDAEVARLPARLRAVVVLCYLGGQSTEDAARELGCPRGTVLSRLAAARARLAARLTRRGVTLPAALVSTAVTRQAVSSAVAAVRAFRAGPLAATASAQLATGVLRAMTRTTILTAAGAVALAAVLTGVGWTAASGDGPAPTAQPIAGVHRPAQPLPPAPKEPPSDDSRRKEDVAESLEKFATTLQHEIELREKAIELAARANGTNLVAAVALLQSHLIETDAEVRKAVRELVQLEAEASVLKKRLDDTTAPDPDPAAVAEAVRKDTAPAVLNAARAKAQLESAKRAAEKPDDPRVKAAQEDVAKAEAAVRDVKADAVGQAVLAHHKAYFAALRQRLDRVELDIAIKRGARDGLYAERNTAQKLLETSAAGVSAIEAQQKALEPQREMLARVQRELLALKAKQSGVTLAEPAGSDAKLDAILREVAALRKDVQELKAKK